MEGCAGPAMISIKPSRLTQILNGFSGQTILVVGDLMLDEFIWGRVERISPEAPVPVVEVIRETTHLGGAANVAANLAALGAHPVPVGVIGADGKGERLLEELQEQGIGLEGVVKDPKRITTVKTRIMAHHQQVCRADRESRTPLSKAFMRRMEDLCRQMMASVDGVILSDYAKGMLHCDLIQALITQAREADQFLAVDPKADHFPFYRRASVITPNKKEVEQAVGLRIFDEDSLLRASRRLLKSTCSDYLLITRGEEGMTLVEDEGHVHIPTVGREVFDVTGAGDTVVASLTLGVAAGATVPEAAILANHAAGVVVGKLGTGAATVGEIRNSIRANA